ncbi:putative transcription factor C2H2 family [Helianthus annuus]|nr:putative transcription factor C2H2 family [Helianthus annuus]
MAYILQPYFRVLFYRKNILYDSISLYFRITNMFYFTVYLFLQFLGLYPSHQSSRYITILNIIIYIHAFFVTQFGVQGISFSAPQDSRPSVSSLSDGSDYEPIAKSQSSHRNFTTRRCFMSKPVHPLTFPPKENATVCHEHRFSMASCDLDFTDVSEPIEPDSLNRPSVNQSYVYKCGLCERFLSQRSPYSSHRIVKSGDFPVTGVLPCRHVFHAECLDQTTPKTRKNDPLCPICGKSDEEITSPEQRVCSKLKNGFPKLKPFREDGPSRPWGCTQAGNCVEGALTAPSKNTMLLLSRNRVKKSLSLKSNSSKKNGSSGSPDPTAVGPSKTASGSDKKS